ncbi:MAG TPA: SusC/RagA family TonB-linked outer membrane protein [Gemmatimonadaceae bacterium]
MKKRILMVLTGLFLSTAQALAQQKTVTGRVTSEQGNALPGVSVVIRGTNTGTSTNTEGSYSIRAAAGQVLQFRLIGNAPEERTVGAENVINVQLRRVATSLDAVVVTALGQTTAQRALGTAQQTVQGTEVAEAQRMNFVNALQGRVAGVEVTSTSGVPGASSVITIRGVTSVSGSNAPLMIVDGLPIDNKTTNTNSLVSATVTGFDMANRQADFTNRAADLNPEDIETLTVLKGPEAAALYGIDAANGAIVITTKRGKAGMNGWEYSNRLRVEHTGATPEIQQKYGLTNLANGFTYFGAPYPAGTQFYNNIDGFFQNATSQSHNLTLSGGAVDSKITYRVGATYAGQEGVVPNSSLRRTNITGASTAQVKDWLGVDLSMAYVYVANDQPFKGATSPFMGLLLWPTTDNAKDWLTPAGTRRRLTTLTSSAELDNPYFNVNKNKTTSRNNRLFANVAFTLTPFSWGSIKSNIGTDTYANQNMILKHPESAAGFDQQGVIENWDDVTRAINTQTVLNLNSRNLFSKLAVSGLVGNATTDYKSTTDDVLGSQFYEPNFVSINNTPIERRYSKQAISQRRVVSAFGSATFDYNRYLYLTLTGRNDWTSTIPTPRNSFFYPSVSGSFIASDAVPSIGKFMTLKLRGGYAEVGKDARPYAYRPVLVSKTTVGGGYGYDFWGPNVNLKPEFAKSFEFGTEMSFLQDRLGVDATWFQKTTEDQIVNDIRGSYATGFVLFNLNGGTTRARGLELTLRGTPVNRRDLSWDVIANWAHTRSIVLGLPNNWPETYSSDTWLYGNVRNGTSKGLSTMSLMGQFYLRNNQGKILIDPTTGLPIRNSNFVDGGYDRQPDWNMGVTNTFRFRRFNLSFLLDFRRGGDVLNATQHYLVSRGLDPSTLDRETPRVIDGVLRDGKENTANPTKNTIAVIPAVQTTYYSNMSEELFIEKDINWMRLRDVTLRYQLPSGKYLHAREASVFVTGTDLFLLTNYTGLDPMVNANTAGTLGSSGVGIDYGNFPLPKGFNFGLSLKF